VPPGVPNLFVPDPIAAGATKPSGPQAKAPPPGPGQAGAQPARQPSYAEWLSARNLRPSDQNFIRFKNDTGAWRTGAPQFSPVTEAASNVGERFPRGDWRRFESGARPSTGVEDQRSNIPGAAFAREFMADVGKPDAGLHWETTPEALARFDPNDPMTRALTAGTGPMRNDVLRNMSPAEFRDWSAIMQDRIQRLLLGVRP
jgi:hypothetical protein